MEHIQLDNGTSIADGGVWTMSLKQDGTLSVEYNKLESSTGKNSMSKRFQDLKSRKLVALSGMQVKRSLREQYMRSVEGTFTIDCSNYSYRRGKSESGDVDCIISNPRPHATQNFCVGLVKVLEQRGIITHTLTISTATSAREENPKHSFRQRGPLGSDRGGYGLDSLDKALVVFLLPEDNPHYTGIHRRVDLIIAPWRAWGTAIVGWTVYSPQILGLC